MTPRDSTPHSSRQHYSYAHYRDERVAHGFDQLRFGGPIGRHLLETQDGLLKQALAPLSGRRVVDVGTGTGRAAVSLAGSGAQVIGLDASPEMLGVARQRADAARVTVQLAVADAHRLPLHDRSVDAAVSLRVLMHALDWRQCVAELCRVARTRVIVDFPALGSLAALESGARHLAHAAGQRVEAYRVIPEAAMRQTFARHGFRIVDVRRQFVLPIALHKRIGSLPFTLTTERTLAALGVLRLFGSPVTMVAER